MNPPPPHTQTTTLKVYLRFVRGFCLGGFCCLNHFTVLVSIANYTRRQIYNWYGTHNETATHSDIHRNTPSPNKPRSMFRYVYLECLYIFLREIVVMPYVYRLLSVDETKSITILAWSWTHQCMQLCINSTINIHVISSGNRIKNY